MKFTIQDVINRAAVILRAGGPVIAIMTLVFGILPSMVFQYLVVKGGNLLDLVHTGQQPAVMLLVALLIYFLGVVHLVIVTEVGLRVFAYKPVKMGSLLAHGLAKAVPTLLLSLGLQIVVCIGSVLLIIPGAFFAVMFSVVVPAYVCEGKAMQAFGRSYELTDGHRWRIALLWLCATILSTVALVATHDPSTLFTTDIAPHRLDAMAVMGFYLTLHIIGTLLMVLNTAVYLSLRFHKKSSAVDDRIALIFD